MSTNKINNVIESANYNFMISKLLRKNTPLLSILLYALANIIGLTIILTGFQLFSEVRHIIDSKENSLGQNYLVIYKPVKTISIAKNTNDFSPEEISRLKETPFFKDFAVFEAARFKIQAIISPNNPALALRTDLFFETVPDRFIEIKPDKWQWTPDMPFIPIIINQSYLNLYNFGFAVSQGLPQVSEQVIQQIELSIRIEGNGKYADFTGKIVGFSQELNTVLVPERFMKWANAEFGSTNATSKVSTVLALPKNPADVKMTEFLAQKNYRVADNQLKTGKTAFILNIFIGSVFAIGFIISILALFLMLMSINLLIHKNQNTFSSLILLGFSRRRIAAPYQKLMIFIALISVGLSCICALWAGRLFHNYIQTLFPNLEFQNTAIVYVAAIILMCLIAGINYFWIRRRLQKLSLGGTM